MTPLRVAMFTDSFGEANGVATLSREFISFAQRRKYPFFCVRSGPQTQAVIEQTVTTLELRRGWASFPLDHDLYCDPLLSRYKDWVLTQVQAFRPEIVHITGPGDMGILGFWIAHLLKVPLIASWHTNLHEYAGRRVHKSFSFLPEVWGERIAMLTERESLRACMWFYGYGRFTLAPNDTMVNLLQERTGRPSFFMAHGVDTRLYSPSRRSRSSNVFCIGYVGRLTPEKNVRLLVELERGLLALGKCHFHIAVIGDGSEREWLRRNLQHGELTGILRGEVLADAYANMDVFVFPSETDTFGLVLLEAMASGVPPVVSPLTGSRAHIQDGRTGFYADDLKTFTSSVIRLMDDEALRRKVSCAARKFACSRGWDGVFDQIYQTYDKGLEQIGRAIPGLCECGQ